MTSKNKKNKVSGKWWVRYKFLKGIHKLKRSAFYNASQRKLNKQLENE